MYILFSRFVILHVCFLLQQTACAQLQDVIYLHNGSVYRGEITELHIDSLVKIKTVGENIVAVQAKDILQIIQNSEPAETAGYFFRNKGFSHYALFGVAAGNDAFNNLAGGVYFETLNGYQFNRRWQALFGALIMASETNLLNLYADSRYHFFVDKNTNFLSADAGFCFPLITKTDFGNPPTNVKPGLYLSPGYGLRINPKKGKLAFIFSFGYMLQQYRQVYEDEVAQTKTTQKYTQQRVTLKLGFAY